MAIDNVPQNNNQKIDYLSLYAHGLSTEQIFQGLRERGLTPDNIVFNDYQFTLNTYGSIPPEKQVIKPQDITPEYHDQALRSYDRFKQGLFNDYVAPYMEYGSIGGLLGNVDRNVVYRELRPGFNERGEMIAKPDQVAAARGWMIDEKGNKVPYKTEPGKVAYNIWNYLNLGLPSAERYFGNRLNELVGLEEYNREEKNLYTNIVVPDEKGIPYIKKVKSDSPEVKREIIMSALGPSPMTDNVLVSINKAIYNSLGPGLQSSAGTLMEVSDNLYDWLFNGYDKQSWLDTQGQRIQNVAANWMWQQSERSKEGAFKSFESFAYNTATVASQVMLQGGLSRMMMSGVDTGKLLTNDLVKQYAKRATINLHGTSGIFGVMAMDSYNQFAKQNKINELDIAWQAPLIFGIEYFTETLIGTGVVAKGTKLMYSRQQLKEAFDIYGNQFKKELGLESLENLSKVQSHNFIKGIINTVGDVMRKPKSQIGMTLAATTEESLEETVAQPFQNVVEYINDWRALAMNPNAKQGEGMFYDLEKDKNFFSWQFLERIPKGMAEATVMGFFGGLSGGAAVLRGKYHQKTLNDFIAEGEEGLLRDTAIKMHDKGLLNYDFVSDNGDVITDQMKDNPDTKTMNDAALKMILEEIEIKSAIRNQYRLNDAKTIGVVGGNTEYLKQAMGLVVDIENTKKKIQNKEIDAKEGNDNINKLRTELKDIIEPEQIGVDAKGEPIYSKHSKRINETVKNNAIFFDQSVKELQEIYKGQNKVIDDKLTTSKEYNDLLIEHMKIKRRLSELGMITQKPYNDVKSFNNDYNEYVTKKNELRGREDIVKVREENTGKFKSLINELKSIARGEQIDQQLTSILDNVGSLVNLSGQYNLNEEDVTEYESILNEISSGLYNARKDEINKYKEAVEAEENEEAGYEEIEKYVRDYNKVTEEIGKIKPEKQTTPVEFYEIEKKSTKKIDLLLKEIIADSKSDTKVLDPNTEQKLKDIGNLIDRNKNVAYFNNVVTNDNDFKDKIKDYILPEDTQGSLTPEQYEQVNKNLQGLGTVLNEAKNAFNLANYNKTAKEISKRQRDIWTKKSIISILVENMGIKSIDGISPLIDELDKITLEPIIEDAILKSTDFGKKLNNIELQLNKISSLLFHNQKIWFTKENIEKIVEQYIHHYGKDGKKTTKLPYNANNDFGSADYHATYNQKVGKKDDIIKTAEGYTRLIEYLFTVTGVDLDVLTSVRRDMLANDTLGNPSTYEENMMENAINAHIEGNNNLMTWMYEAEKKFVSKLRATILTDEIILNSVVLRGGFGTGKTNHVLRTALLLHREYTKRLTGKSKELKVLAIGHSTKNKADLIDTLDITRNAGEGLPSSVKAYSPKELVNGSILDYDGYDIVFFDEASLISLPHKERIEKALKGKKVFFLGDNSQMQSISAQYSSEIFWKFGLRTMPLTLVFSNDLPLINQLAEYYAKNKTGVAESQILYTKPLLFRDTRKNGEGWIGGKYFATKEDIIKDFNDSTNNDKAIIFLTAKQAEDAIKNNLIKEEDRSRVYSLSIDILSDELSSNIESIQGLRKDEVYIAIDFANDIQSMDGDTTNMKNRIGYTAVGRARYYVAIQGPIENNANDKTQVTWEDEIPITDKKRAYDEMKKRELVRLNAITTGEKKKQPDIADKDNTNVKYTITDYSKNKVYAIWAGRYSTGKNYIKIKEEDGDSLIGTLVNEQGNDIPIEGSKTSEIKIPKLDIQPRTQSTTSKGEAIKDGDVTKYKEYIVGDIYRNKKDGSIVQLQGINVEGGSVEFKLDDKWIDAITMSDYEKTEQHTIDEIGDVYHNENVGIKKWNKTPNTTWGTTYSVVTTKDTTKEEKDQIRSIKPYLLDGSLGLKYQLVFHKSLMLEDEDGVNKIFNNVLAVELIAPDDTTILLSKIEGKAKDKSNYDLISKAIDDIKSNGLSHKYTMIGTLSYTEIGYAVDGKAESIDDRDNAYTDAEYNKIKQAIKDGFVNGETEDDKNNDKTLQAINLHRAELRKRGYDNAVDGRYVFLDKLSLDIIQGRPVYNVTSSGFFGKGIKYSELKEKVKDSFAFGKPFQGFYKSGKKGLKVLFTRSSHGRPPIATEPYIVLRMPRLSEVDNWKQKFIDYLDSDYDRIPAKGTELEFTTHIKTMFLHEWLQNNRSILTDKTHKFLNDYSWLSKYVVFEQKGKYLNLDFIVNKDKNETIKDVISNLIEEFKKLDESHVMFIGKTFIPSAINTKGDEVIFNAFTGETNPEDALVTDVVDIHAPYFYVTVDNVKVEEKPKEVKSAFNGIKRTFKKDTIPANEIRVKKEIVTQLAIDILGEDFLNGKHLLLQPSVENGTLHGMMMDGKIFLEETKKGIEYRTLKHETFHIVWNYFLSPGTKANILKEIQQYLNDNNMSSINAEEWAARVYGSSGIEKSTKWFDKFSKYKWIHSFFKWMDGVHERWTNKKALLDELLHDIDTGVYRNREIVLSNEPIIRHFEKDDEESIEEPDEGLEDEEVIQKKRDNHKFLLDTFGSNYVVNQMKNQLGQFISDNSSFSSLVNIDNVSFKQAFQYAIEVTANKSLELSMNTVGGKKISDITRDDLNGLNDQDFDNYVYYKLGQEDVFNALSKEVFKTLNFEKLEDNKNTTGSLVDYWKDFNPNSNQSGFYKWQLSVTPYREYSNGVLNDWDGRTYVGIHDLDGSLKEAGQIVNKKYATGEYTNKTDLFFDTLLDLSERIGENNVKSNNIKSFLARWTGYGNDIYTTQEPGLRTIIKLIEDKPISQRSDIEKARALDLSAFINNMISYNTSLVKNERSVIEVVGHGEYRKFKYVSFNNDSWNEIKHGINDNIKRVFYGVGDSLNKDKLTQVEGKNKLYTISSNGLSYKNKPIIERVGNNYLFVDNIKSNGKIDKQALNIITKFLGLNVIQGAVFESLANNSSPRIVQALSETITGLNTQSDRFTEQALAEGIMSMMWSISDANEIMTERLKKPDTDFNGRYAEERREYNNRYAISETALEGLGDILSTDDISSVSNDRLPSPLDSYNFFTLLSIAEDSFRGNNFNKFYYGPDGKKRYVYRLRSHIDDVIGYGSKVLVKKINKKTNVFKNNPLFNNAVGLEITSVNEMMGIRYGKRGSTSVTSHDLTMMSFETFLHSLRKSKGIEELVFPMTNISDTGKILNMGVRFDLLGKERLFNAKFNEDGNIKELSVNENVINRNINALFEYKHDEFLQSKERWINTLKQLKDNKIDGIVQKFGKFFIDNKRTAKQFEADFSTIVLSKEEIAILQNTQLIENKDYRIKETKDKNGVVIDSKLLIGFDLSFNLTNPEENIYTEDNYNIWKTKKGEELTKYRDSLFEVDFKLLDRRIRESKYNVPDHIKRLNKGKYAVFNTQGKLKDKITEWNPFFKGYFYGYEIANASVNPLINGSQNEFKDNTARSKYTGPKNTGGTSLVIGSKNALRNNFRLIIAKDLEVIDPVTSKDGIESKVSIGDGQMEGNPLLLPFLVHSLGGYQYGPIDKTVLKTLYSGIDYPSGSHILVKHSDNNITGDLFKNSQSYRNMFKDMLAVTDRAVKAIHEDYDMDLYDTFLYYYDTYNDFDEAIERTVEDILKEDYADDIINNLVWGIQNKTGVKHGARYVNSYNPNDIERQPLTSIVLNTEDLKLILNPYQDIEKINNLTMMNQILSYVGIDNPLLSKSIQDSLKTLSLIGEERIQKEFNDIVIDNRIEGDIPQWVARMDKYLRKKGLKNIAEMASIGYFGDIISDNDATIQGLATKTKLLQIYRNSVTRNSIKVPMTGLRMVQASGYHIPLYIDNVTGIPYLLSDIEKRLGRRLNDGEVIEGFTVSRLGTMMPTENGIRKAQILAPNVYAKKFGIRKDETLNDAYSIVLTDGTVHNFRQSIKTKSIDELQEEIKQILAANIRFVDVENSPALRYVNLDKPSNLEEDLTEAGQLRYLANTIKSIATYYQNLDYSLQVYAGRVPANRLGSGMVAEVVGFISDNGNTVYIPPESTKLADDDFDIDQKSVYYRAFDRVGDIPNDPNTKEYIHNQMLDNIESAYYDKNNHGNIFISSDISDLRKLSEDGDKNVYTRAYSFATMLNNYEVNKVGDRAIGILANGLSAISYMQQLSVQQINNYANGFRSIIAFKNLKGSQSLNIRNGNYLQSALDNAKELVLGKLGLKESAIPYVTVATLEMSDVQMKEFFYSKPVRDVFSQLDKRLDVVDRGSYFDIFSIINEYKNKYKELSDEERASIEKTIGDETKAYNEANEEWNKLNELMHPKDDKEAVYVEQYKFDDLSKVTADKTASVKTLESKLKGSEYIKILNRLYDIALRSQALSRFSSIISQRNGVKAIDYDFELFINNAQLFFGMSLNEFLAGKSWNKEDHIKYFKENNNQYLSSKKEEKDTIIKIEEGIISQMNLAEVVRAFPMFEQYVKIYNDTEIKKESNGILHKFWVYDGKMIDAIKKAFFKDQFQAFWLSRQQRTDFYNHVTDYLNDLYFKKYYRGEKNRLNIQTWTNMGIDDTTITGVKATSMIDMPSARDRDLFGRQFPLFVSELKEIASMTRQDAIKKLNQIDPEYVQWYDKIAGNEFLRGMNSYGYFGNEKIGLVDNFAYTDADIDRLHKSYLMLPEQLKDMFKAYEVHVNKMQYRKGGLLDIIGMDLHKGDKSISKFFNEFNDNPDEEVAQQFADYIQLHSGMARYMNSSDRMDNGVPKRKYIEGYTAVKGRFKYKIREKYDQTLKSYYPEYLITSTGGFDGENSIITEIEPLHNLTADELDKIKLNNEIVKEFLKGSGYEKYDKVSKGLYITSNGELVIVADSDGFKVKFSKVTEEIKEYIENRKKKSLEAVKEVVNNDEDRNIVSREITSIVTKLFPSRRWGNIIITDTIKGIYLQFPNKPKFSLESTLEEYSPEYKAVYPVRNQLDKLFNYYLDNPDKFLGKNIVLQKSKGIEVIDQSKPKEYAIEYAGDMHTVVIDNGRVISTSSDKLSDLVKNKSIEELSKYVDTTSISARDSGLSEVIRERAVTKQVFDLLLNHLKKVDPTIVFVKEDNNSVLKYGKEYIDKIAWVDENGVHYNSDMMVIDGFIHEMQHVWNSVFKKYKPEIWRKLEAEAMKMINERHPVYKYVWSLGARKGKIESREWMIDEIISYISGFTSIPVIEEFLLKNNITEIYKPGFIKDLYDRSNEGATEVAAFVNKDVLGNEDYKPSTNVWEGYEFTDNMFTDVSTTLRELLSEYHKAVFRDYQFKPVIDINTQDVIKQAYSDIWNAREVIKKPITKLSEITPYIQNVFNANKSLAAMSDDELVKHLGGIIRRDGASFDGKHHNPIWIGRDIVHKMDAPKNSKSFDVELDRWIRSEILPEFKLFESSFKEKMENFINVYNDAVRNKKERNIYKIADDVFGKNVFSHAVINELMKYFGAGDTIVNAMKYSDLVRQNDTLKQLYDEDFIGYDPIVVIHSLKDGKVNLSILDGTSRPLMHGAEYVDPYFTAALNQPESEFRYNKGEWSNRESNIRKSMVGLLMMSMKKKMGDKITFGNIGVLEIHGSTMKPYMIQDIGEALRNIKASFNNKYFLPNLSNDNIKSVITDDKLYNIGLYGENYLNKLGLYLSEKRLTVNSNYLKNDLEEQSNIILSKETTMYDMRDVLKKVQLDVMNEISKGRSGEELARLQNEELMVAQAIRQLETGEMAFSNDIHDMSSKFEQRMTIGYNVKSDILQMLIGANQVASEMVVEEYMKYFNDIVGLVTDVAKLSRGRNPIEHGERIVRDMGSIYFANLFKKVEAVDKDGNKHTVPIPEVHHTLTDADTKRLYDNGGITDKELELANKLLDYFEKRWIDNIYVANKSNAKYLAANGKMLDSYTREDAKDEFMRTYRRGRVPTMDKSVIDYLFKLEIKKGLRKEVAQMGNVEEYYNDMILSKLPGGAENLKDSQTYFNAIYNALNQQKDYDVALARIGLQYNEGKYYLINKEYNDNMGTDLVRTSNYFMMDGIRTEIYNREVLPIRNTATTLFNWLQSTGNVQKNNMNFMREYIDRNIFRRTQDAIVYLDDPISGSLINPTNTVRTALHAFQFLQLSYSSVLAAKSLTYNVINQLISSNAASIANGVVKEGGDVGQLPGNSDMAIAFKQMSTNPRKALELIKFYHLVNRSERDVLTSPFINPAMKGNMMKEQWAQVGNYLTDSGARALAMVSWMVKEGSWDAYSWNVKEGVLEYDVSKDKRYKNYKTDPKQKALMDDLVVRLKTQNLMDKDGVVPTRGHDWVMINDHLKWYGNKFVVGGYDNTVKALIGTTWFGAMFSQYRYFSFDKFFNAGLYAGTRFQKAGAKWVAVKDENGNWISKKELMEIEGAYQSIGKAVHDLKEYMKNANTMKMLGPIGWYKEQSYTTRYNIASSIIRVMTFTGMVFAVMGIASGDDDERKFKWLYTDILVWMGTGQWLANPFPMVSAVLQLSDIAVGKRNLDSLERFSGPYRDVKMYEELISGEEE